jgi:hypothetical protein
VEGIRSSEREGDREGRREGVRKDLCSLRGTNTLLDKCILFRPLISILCQKAPKVYIDLIINWY